jgi:hypothetical protein
VEESLVHALSDVLDGNSRAENQDTSMTGTSSTSDSYSPHNGWQAVSAATVMSMAGIAGP